MRLKLLSAEQFSDAWVLFCFKLWLWDQFRQCQTWYLSIPLHKRVSEKMKIYPKNCVNLGMLCPKGRQFRHPTTRVLLKFTLSLPKIPTLPKATQMFLKFDTNKIVPIRNFTRSWNNFTQALLVVLVTNIMSGSIFSKTRHVAHSVTYTIEKS